MRRRRLLVAFAGTLLLLICMVLFGPALVRAGWSARASNPVRRGLARASELGCFGCHGQGGAAGVPDPGLGEGTVPAWGGMVWMMYVSDAEEIRETILDGVSRKRAASASAREERARAEIWMPAYRDRLRGRDLEDLVAAFQALSGMTRPAEGTDAARGLAVAQRWRCLSCHGPAAAGGVSNPGSFAGFIPGWYGADFTDLVRDRREFDAWIRDGEIPRLARHPVASFFTQRQKLQMPTYKNLPPEDLDALWAYAGWLAAEGNGVAAVEE